ncbi:Aldehyde dehydrogenase family 3 member H1 [Striga hermonthica]|uniref:Aldehyde dehydrogenase n=1 Tax=Striga hermonthica TaxID=68872 RepID=A0A9N7P1F5_STRHE|nr:Aldehyde dehydrogenase family 3 member H1 [Striga hermonthica]
MAGGTLNVAAVTAELRSTFAAGKTRTFQWRVSQLKALLKMATQHEGEIVRALRADLNKPELEAFAHEINQVQATCRQALKELNCWMKPKKVRTSLLSFPSSAEIVPEPLGLVLVISTWNFPFLLSVAPVIGAIAAGNTVVLKPSEVAPATSSLLAKLLGEYLDTSAVKVVEGAVPEATALLEQKWDKIFYTGNGKVGRVVLAAAAKHLTPVVLELGGKSPVVVDTDINLKVAAKRIIWGKWACNNGQTCISPDYVITTKEYACKVVDALKAELEKFYGKDPIGSKDLSSIVNTHHFDRVSKLLEDDKVYGTIVCGGQQDRTNLKIAPTILLDVPEDSLIMNEEIFGPLLPIITVNKIDECFRLINGKERPLAAYLFTNNKKLKEEFIGNILAGGMTINDTVLHFSENGLPFGGVGESGMGAYHGKFSFDAFSHKKAVLKRCFIGEVPQRYPPYNRGKMRFFRELIRGNVFGVLGAMASSICG